MMRRFRDAGLALALLTLGCSDNTPKEQPSPLIAIRRHWLPGERQALIDSIIARRSYTFLYVGDISDLAPQLYADTDSVSVIVPNPAYTPSASITGPSPAPGAVTNTQFSSTWNFVFVKIVSINQSQTPPDSVFWHMALWVDPNNGGNHGFMIGFSRTDVFSFNQVNATTFDGAFGKSGAGAGEFHSATTTLWEDKSSAGKFQSQSEAWTGSFATITTGPYLGGVARTGTAYGQVANSTFTRVSGTELPTSFGVAFDYRIAGLPATEIDCIFPSPCTTNVALMASAWRRAHQGGVTPR